MKLSALICLVLGVSVGALCSTIAAPANGLYRTAERSFLMQSTESRIELQQLLTAAGYWAAVSNEEFGNRLFEAINRFQAANGFAQDGIVSTGQRKHLQTLAAPVLESWGLSVVRHPQTGTPLWVPRGFNLTNSEVGYGLSLTSPLVSVFYSYAPAASIVADAERLSAVSSGRTIDYKVIRNDFAVVVAHTEFASEYSRFHAYRDGVLGFTLIWKNDEEVHGDRLATMMSDLFRTTMSGTRKANPPSAGN